MRLAKNCRPVILTVRWAGSLSPAFWRNSASPPLQTRSLSQMGQMWVAEPFSALLLKCHVLAKPLAWTAVLIFASIARAQQPAQPNSSPAAAQTQVKVNILNVCNPSKEEQQEIASALARIPKQPLFSPDFEVDRGRSTFDQKPEYLQAGLGTALASDALATWVRIRREFSVQALFSTVQYSFSVDSQAMVETLVFHVRDPKDLLEVSIEDSASAVTSPAAMLGESTPASRVKLERFGKSSIALARCPATERGPAPDQTAYEPLFQSASAVVANYRTLLAAARTVPDELRRTRALGAAKAAAKKSAGH
jgi:hypothetical protein